MALRGLGRRLRAPVEQLDDERLQHRFEEFGLQPIGEAPSRLPIKVGGEIGRVLIAPRNGVPTLEIRVSDGTGQITAVFTGRRTLGGVAHGRGIVLEGVAHDERGRRIILNPAYTLLGH